MMCYTTLYMNTDCRVVWLVGRMIWLQLGIDLSAKYFKKPLIYFTYKLELCIQVY